MFIQKMYSTSDEWRKDSENYCFNYTEIDV